MKRSSSIGLIALVLAKTAWAQIDVDWVDQEIKAKTGWLENRRSLSKSAFSSNLNAYDVTYYGLNLQIDVAGESLSGKTVIRGIANQDNLQQIELDLDNVLTVMAVGDDATGYTHINDILTITLNRSLNITDTFRVSIEYSGTPQVSNSKGFFFKYHNGAPVISTLSEPYYAHTWFPCKDRVIDKVDSADITITVPHDLIAVSNGILVRTTVNNDNTKTFYWQERYPIAVYLISIAVSNYTYWNETYTSRDQNRTMPLEYWVYPESESNARPYLDKTADMLTCFSNIWGEYPFIGEKYGQAQFSWSGGMEHQTATSLGAFSELLICHELAHSWWGDDVTCASWQDIWLNEGFARYAEALWYENLYGQDGLTGYMTAINRPTRWSSGSIYIQDTTSSSNIFNLIVYDKGAWVLHMLRGLVGDEQFYEALATYRQNYRGSVATTEDFQRVCENVYGQSLDWFFAEWIYGYGLPNYTVNWRIQRHSPDSWQMTVTLKQIQTTATIFRMPLELYFSDGVNDTSYVIADSLESQTFSLFCNFRPDSIAVDPNNWVLKTVSCSASDPQTLPDQFHLYSPFPNPFNQSVTIKLDLPYNTHGRIVICDLLGREVAVIADGLLEAGYFTSQWQPPKMASGLYFVRFSGAHQRLQRKIIYLK